MLILHLSSPCISSRQTSAQHHFNEGGEFPLTIDPERFGVSRKDYVATMNRCFPIHFGPYIHPQWRDKLLLALAAEEGWEVRFLDGYDGRGGDEFGREEEGGGIKEPRGARRGQGKGKGCGEKEGSGVEDVRYVEGMRMGGGRGGGREGGREEGRKPVLYWLPFYRLTSERLDLHPYNEWKGKYDCTHYCYTPFLWDPLVEGLAKAVEEEGRGGCDGKV